MSELLYVIALSAGSIVAIFILTKIMGYRQMSQMSMFDYIIGITIGSIAAEMSTSLDKNFMQPLVAMVVYAVFSVILSAGTSHSIRFRRLVEGKPLVLMDHGELYYDNLRRAKIDVSEFLEQCRVNGYFDVSKLQSVILEGNGKFSFLPKETERPMTPADAGLSPRQEFMVANVILDGKIMHENLRHTGNDENWLTKQIKGQGGLRVEDVLLATCDMDNHLTVFAKDNKKMTEDVLM